MIWLDRVLRRRTHYRHAFTGASGDAVLADLKRFCRGGASPVTLSLNETVDPIATAVRIGRQEVFQRIITHLHIDDAQLLKIREEADS